MANDNETENQDIERRAVEIARRVMSLPPQPRLKPKNPLYENPKETRVQKEGDELATRRPQVRSKKGGLRKPTSPS